MTLTEAELGYLAGLIDGEGCINIFCSQGRYYGLQVVTAQSNEYLLDYWQKKTGLGTVHYINQKACDRYDKWHWHCSQGNAALLLELVKPYLILKKEEAQIALEFVEMCAKQKAQYRGKGKPRITDDMLKSREAYKVALHQIKDQRNGAELEKSLTVDVCLPEPLQISLF